MGCLCVRMHCVGKLEVGGLLRLVCFWFIAFLFLFFCLILLAPPSPLPFYLASLPHGLPACWLVGRHLLRTTTTTCCWLGAASMAGLDRGPWKSCLPGKKVVRALACPGGDDRWT